MKIKKRHSKDCPCNENIKVQSEFFGKTINKLAHSSPKKRFGLIAKASPCFIKYLSHCACGILKGHIKLTKKKLKELRKEKKVLMKLVTPKLSLGKKKQLLMKEQIGGFLGVLAGIASATLSSIIGNQIANLFSH